MRNARNLTYERYEVEETYIPTRLVSNPVAVEPRKNPDVLSTGHISLKLVRL